MFAPPTDWEAQLHAHDQTRIEDFKRRFELISVKVLDDPDNFPEAIYPNCFFEVTFNLKESIATPMMHGNKTIEIMFSNANSTDNLRLDTSRNINITGSTPTGIQTVRVPYFKKVVDPDRGDFGRMNVSIRYRRGLGNIDVTERPSRWQNILLYEVGRPGDGEVRLRFETRQNANPADRNNFMRDDDGKISARNLDNLFNRMQGRFAGSVDTNIAISGVTLALGAAGAVASAAGAAPAVVAAAGIASTLTMIASGADLVRSVFSTGSTSNAEPLEWLYRIEYTRKWAQYKDKGTGKWLNAFYSERAFVMEHFKPESNFQRDFGFRVTRRFFRYDAEWYRTLGSATINPISLRDGGVHRARLLREWRIHRRHNNGGSNVNKPGRSVQLIRHLTGDLAHRMNNSNRDQIPLEVSIEAYRIPFSAIQFHQDPDRMTDREPNRHIDLPFEEIYGDMISVSFE